MSSKLPFAIANRKCTGHAKPNTQHPTPDSPFPTPHSPLPISRLWLTAIIVTIGFWTIPAQAQVSDSQVSALVEALRLAAPKTGTENDGLYSEWQIKPDNIPRWSKQCTGRAIAPTDFAASPVTARSILVCVMRDILREQYNASGNNESVAIQRTAAWWMTGDGNQFNKVPKDSYTYKYIQSVLKFYQEQRSNAQSPQPITSPPQETAKPAQPTSTPPAQTTATASANSEISDSQVSALVEAIRLAAPKTGTENDGLYSEWQIKPENIPRWSKQCIGKELTPTDFEANPTTARTVLACVMKDILSQEYNASGKNESVAVQRAASWWMTGNPNQYNSNSTSAYTQKVLAFYRQSFLRFSPHL